MISTTQNMCVPSSQVSGWGWLPIGFGILCIVTFLVVIVFAILTNERR